MSWSYAYAYRAGEGHGRCDDVCVCETIGDTILAAVADGAGSAGKAREGAATACRTFMDLGVQVLAGSIDPTCLISEIQSKLPSGDLVSHSCTLVAVAAGPREAVFLQVGDGAAVVRTDDAYRVAIWPEETEFLNHTFFVTAPDAADHLLTYRPTEPIREFALFTDGLQHLVLNPKLRGPHEPFFRTVFRPLANAPDHDRRTSWWLERQLGSDHVTKRTDDDTSIVIARRLSC